MAKYAAEAYTDGSKFGELAVVTSSTVMNATTPKDLQPRKILWFPAGLTAAINGKIPAGSLALQ